MKKFISFILITAMALSLCAFAESVESTEAAPEGYDASSTDGWTEITINDISMHFYVPAGMQEGEAVGDQLWFSSDADLALSLTKVDGSSTLDDINTRVANAGFSVSEENKLNVAIDHEELVKDGDDTYNAIMFQGSDGNYYLLECYAFTDTGAAQFETVLSTLETMTSESVEG